MRNYMKDSYELNKGYEAEEMVALLQKSLRRSELNWSLFAAMELYHSAMGDYIWERLIIISAEDMYGAAVANMQQHATDYFEAKLKGDEKGMLKAIYNGVFYASRGLKSRDADNLVCVGYLNDVEKTNVEKYLDNKGTEQKFEIIDNLFETKVYKFEENQGWLDYIIKQNQTTAHYVSFDKHTVKDINKHHAALLEAYAKGEHKIVACLLYAMIENDYVYEAWTFLKKSYVDKYAELEKEFKAMIFSKEQISQQKESKLYVGKTITLYLLLEKGVDISNEVEIKFEENYVDKYYTNFKPAYLPAYTYDLHTTRGRLMHFTQREFLARENEYLVPKAKEQLFDKYLEDNIENISH